MSGGAAQSQRDNMAEEETAQAEQESTTETFTKEQVQELLAKEIEGLANSRHSRPRRVRRKRRG
jgi:hypothetical protein